MKTKYFTIDTLIAANKVAIKTHRNRTLEPKALKALDASGMKFPVGISFVHNDVEMRLQVAIGQWDKDGKAEFLGTVWIDVPFETYSKLPETGETDSVAASG